MSAFVLNRKYELALPTSYVDVDNEEMEYVDGGEWNSYRGNAALLELTNMYANCWLFAGVTKKMVAAAVACATTGIGVGLAIATSLGIGCGLALTVLQGSLAAIASSYYLSDRGFKANSYSACGWAIYTGVSRL